MNHFIIISGSIREGRLSPRVCTYLSSALGQHGRVEVLDLAEAQFPLFNNTIDKQTEPHPLLTEWWSKLKSADAFLFLNPEYNGSYTAAFKNLIDAIPPSTFKRKPIGIVSTTTGPLGGMRGAQQTVLLSAGLMAYTVPQLLLVPKMHEKIDASGNLIDESFQKPVSNFIAELIWITEKLSN
jgi:NAD(P)H-dependent FMN reductase